MFPELIWQIFALALLVIGTLAVWRMARSKASPTPAAEGQLALVLFSAMTTGGFLGGLAWWADYPASFAWDLPPLASRLLASAGWAYAAAGLYGLSRPDRAHMRLLAVLLAVYLAPLALAIAGLHLDRFDWQAAITPAFFAIVLPMTLGALWFSVRPIALAPDVKTPAAGPLPRTFLMVSLVAFGAWGLAIFALPDGPVKALWLWPTDPLTSRLIGVMLLALASASIMARRENRLTRAALLFHAVYGFCALAAVLWNLTSGKPVPLFYAAMLGGTGLAAALLLAKDRGNPAV